MSGSISAAIAAYDEAQTALLGLIGGDCSGFRGGAARIQRAEARLRRSIELLASLGNPHHRYPIVHVTGTSGKGSTCAAIAAILSAAGYRVGLRTSPYLQVATEKLQIGPSLIDAFSFANRASDVLAASRRLYTDRANPDRFGYAEAWNGIAFSWFAQREIDIAVVEVGAGGRFDATNVVDPVVSVITSVGLDHVVSLGPTLADIAWHKAGIIKPGSIAVLGDLPADPQTIVLDAAREAQAPVIRAGEVAFDQHWQMKSPGAFQHGNARIAVAAIEALRRQGFAVPVGSIGPGLAAARLPGRLELMPNSEASSPNVWIDGAHNPDKIAAVAGEAERGAHGGIPPVVVLGILDAKDAKAIGSIVTAFASAIVTTQPSVLGKRSLPAAELANEIHACKFCGPISSEPSPDDALQRAISLASDTGADVLVTGSLYLAGQLRRHWYPDAHIVEQRTPWPHVLPGKD